MILESINVSPPLDFTKFLTQSKNMIFFPYTGICVLNKQLT